MGNDKNAKAIFDARSFMTEIAVSLSQVAIFFFLALFSSNFLRDKAMLTAFADQRVDNTTFFEFWLTILSIAVVCGLISMLLQATRNHPGVGNVAKLVLLEMPRTISIFGSSIFAVLLALAIHLRNYPEPDTSTSFGRFFLIGLMFWFVSFIYSFGIKPCLTGHLLIKGDDQQLI